MNRKSVIARINVIFVIIFLIPALFFISRAINDHKILDTANLDDTPIVQNDISPEVDLETKQMLNEFVRQVKENGEQQEKVNKRIYLLTFVTDLLVASSLLSFSILMLISKVEIKDNKLRYRSFLKTGEIPLESITEILVNRTTPLHKDELRIEKISWRKKVIINDGKLVLSGFHFPNLNLIVSKISEINPNIIVDYYINTLFDNVQNR